MQPFGENDGYRHAFVMSGNIKVKPVHTESKENAIGRSRVRA